MFKIKIFDGEFYFDIPMQQSKLEMFKMVILNYTTKQATIDCCLSYPNQNGKREIVWKVSLLLEQQSYRE